MKNLKDEIEGIVKDSDLLARLNELADLLYEKGDTRLVINTDRGQWVWFNKDHTSLIEQEKEVVFISPILYFKYINGNSSNLIWKEQNEGTEKLHANIH